MPFRGEHEAAVMYSIMNEDPQPFEKSAPTIPAFLITVVNRALEKDPAKRYQDLGELISDLEMTKSGGVPTVITMPTAVRRSKPLWIVAAAIVLLTVVGISYFLLSSRSASATNKTIAVLPFNNMSGNPEDEYLSDGMTEDILTQLGKIADLRVISRTTMMQYKGTKKSLRDIAKELNAGVVLEGSVRRVADQLRITAQLIDAGSDAHLWAEMYDKDFSRIFAIQSDVAQKIAAALEAKLSPTEKQRIEKKPTLNIEAYKWYLKGREYASRNRKQDNETAIDLFTKAITLDSAFALAWAELGNAYAERYGFGAEISWLDSATAVSKKAMALDTNSAEAYNALAICYSYDGKYDKALEAYHKAIDLNPNYFGAVGNIGTTYTSQGRFDEALLWLKKALVLAPGSPVLSTQVSYAYLQLGDVVQGERWLMKALELQPDYQYANIDLANLYALQGKGQQANELMKKVVIVHPEDPRIFDNAGAVAEATGNFSLAKEYYERSMKANPSFATDPGTSSGIGLGRILLKEGKRNEARRLLKQARALQQKQIEEGDTSFDPLHYLAAISAIEGNTKEATAWLRKAIDAGFRDLDPNEPGSWFENLRNDGEYKQIVAQFKAQLDSMRKKVEEMEK
jgi:TolB-like protein/Flp pilus assembly protein TadD